MPGHHMRSTPSSSSSSPNTRPLKSRSTHTYVALNSDSGSAIGALDGAAFSLGVGDGVDSEVRSDSSSSDRRESSDIARFCITGPDLIAAERLEELAAWLFMLGRLLARFGFVGDAFPSGLRGDLRGEDMSWASNLVEAFFAA